MPQSSHIPTPAFPRILEDPTMYPHRTCITCTLYARTALPAAHAAAALRDFRRNSLPEDTVVLSLIAIINKDNGDSSTTATPTDRFSLYQAGCYATHAPTGGTPDWETVRPEPAHTPGRKIRTQYGYWRIRHPEEIAAKWTRGTLGGIQCTEALLAFCMPGDRPHPVRPQNFGTAQHLTKLGTHTGESHPSRVMVSVAKRIWALTLSIGRSGQSSTAFE